MEEFKYLRGIALLLLLLFSLSAHAQSAKHFDFSYGYDYSLIEAKSLLNPTQVKLISLPQTAFGFDFQYGRFGKAWYVSGQFVKYAFKDDPAIAPVTADGLSGQQKNFELGRWRKIVPSSSISIRYAISYRDVLYVDYPDVAFHLKSSAMPGLVFDLNFPLTQFSSLNSSNGQEEKTGSGVFVKLHANQSFGVSSDGPHSVFLYNGKISLKQKMGDSFEFELTSMYGVETLKTNDYDQKRTDLSFGLTLRYVPQIRASFYGF